jgi:hypothetical protein
MKKATKPAATTKLIPKRPAPKPLAAKPQVATAKSSAKPKATAKPSPKPNPREVQGQAVLLQVVAAINQLILKQDQAVDYLIKSQDRLIENQGKTIHELNGLAQNLANLTDVIDRLVDVTIRSSQVRKQHDQSFETPEPPRGKAVDLATSQQPELEPSDLTAPPEEANSTDSKALEEYPGMPEPPEDE